MNILEEARQKSSGKNVLQQARENAELRKALSSEALLRKVPAEALGFAEGVGEFGSLIANALPHAPINPTASLMGVDPQEYGYNNYDYGKDYQIPSPDFRPYIDEDLSSALRFYGGKYGPASYKLLAPLLKKGLSLTNRAVGNKIINKANATEKTFKTDFDDLFRVIREQGVNKVTRKPVTQKLYNDYKRIVPLKERLSLKDFMKHNTLENSHWAQSDISTALRKMERAYESSPTNSLAKAINAGRSIKKKLLKSIDNQLKYHGLEKEASKYRDLRHQFKERMAPYRENESIVRARLNPSQKDYIEPYRLPHELGLKSGDSFRRTMGKEFPELLQNRLLAGPLGKFGLGAVGAASLPALIRALSGEH